MPHFPDLEPYGPEADGGPLGLPPLAVGWLRRGRPFAQGVVPAGFLERLLDYCRPNALVNQFPRPLACALDGKSVAVESGGQEIFLGRGEMRVIGDNDIFAAPDLIYHYVRDHGYRPPAAFIKAVFHGPGPGSVEYQAVARAYQAWL